LKSDREYLDHIGEEILFIIKNTGAVSKIEFMNNPILKRAVVRSIEVIGEAVKNISSELKKRHPDIDWRKIGDMRNRSIHAYFAVDYDIVWDIVQNKIPELNNRIDKIKSDERTLWD